MGTPNRFAPLVASHPNLVIARTMSKGFGLAALRVGYLIGDPELIDIVTRVRIPFSISLMGSGDACRRWDEPKELAYRTEFISSEADRLHAAMQQIEGVESYPSDGNFVLADISASGRSVSAVVDSLLAADILIRAMGAHGLKGFAHPGHRRHGRAERPLPATAPGTPRPRCPRGVTAAMSPHFLAFDVGTSGVKVVVVDANGCLKDSSYRPYGCLWSRTEASSRTSNSSSPRPWMPLANWSTGRIRRSRSRASA